MKEVARKGYNPMPEGTERPRKPTVAPPPPPPIRIEHFYRTYVAGVPDEESPLIIRCPHCDKDIKIVPTALSLLEEVE